MVLENLTLFEVHLDNARIGPTMADEDEPETETAVEDEAAEAGTADESGPSIGRLVIASVVVSIVVSLVAWKLAGDDEEPDVTIDAPEEVEDAVDVAVED